jgi:hypothetical protein
MSKFFQFAFSVGLGIGLAAGQSADITGWHGVPWGSSKNAFRRALGCRAGDYVDITCAEHIYLRDCQPLPISTDPKRRESEKTYIEINKKIWAEYHHCEPADADMLQIDDYTVNDIWYRADIIFAKGAGLMLVILSYAGTDSDAYQTAFAELRGRYGEGTPVPKDNSYEWTWVKPHGNLTLSVFQDGGFTISYSAKKGRNTL